jgi:hypothetical protein
LEGEFSKLKQPLTKKRNKRGIQLHWYFGSIFVVVVVVVVVVIVVVDEDDQHQVSSMVFESYIQVGVYWGKHYCLQHQVEQMAFVRQKFTSPTGR